MADSKIGDIGRSIDLFRAQNAVITRLRIIMLLMLGKGSWFYEENCE